MSSFLIRITLLVLLFTATGCPYESEVPIDEPSVAVPTALPGVWMGVSDSGAVITVTAADAYTFHIKYEKNSEGTKYYAAYLSHLRNMYFMNLRTRNQDSLIADGTYIFYKFELSADGTRLTLSPVTENIREKFTTSRSQKAYFRKHAHTSFFYEIDEDLMYKKSE